MARRKRRGAIQPMPPDDLGRPRWWVDKMIGGNRIRKVVYGDLDQVKSWLFRQLAEAAENRQGFWFRKIGFAEMAREFCDVKQSAEASEEYLKELRRCLVDTCAARWGRRDPRSITARDINRVMEERRQQGAGGRTRQKDLRMLGTLFNWAVAMHYCPDNPCQAAEKPKAEKVRKDWLTTAEYRKVWLAAPEYLREILDVLAGTGARVGEFLRIQLEDLAPEGLYLRRSKVGDRHCVPLVGEIRALFLRQSGSEGAVLFKRPQSDGQGGREVRDTWDKYNLRNAIKRAVSKAGIRKKIAPHSFRHTLASWLVAARGIDLARKVLGHTAARTTELYDHAGRMDWSAQREMLPARVAAQVDYLCGSRIDNSLTKTLGSENLRPTGGTFHGQQAQSVPCNGTAGQKAG